MHIYPNLARCMSAGYQNNIGIQQPEAATTASSCPAIVNDTIQKLTKSEARRFRGRLAAIDPADSHAQIQCPLFGKLPSEMRNIIYKYALLRDHGVEHAPNTLAGSNKDQDLTQECSRESKFLNTVHLELLRTCRRIYHETGPLVLGLSEPCGTTIKRHSRFWSMHDLERHVRRMTATNVLHLNKIGLHLAAYYDVCETVYILKAPQFQPNHLRLTMPFPMWDLSNLDQVEGSFVSTIFPLFVGILWPCSLRTMTIEFYSGVRSDRSDTAISVERWKEEFTSVHDLQLILKNGVELNQREPVAFRKREDSQQQEVKFTFANNTPWDLVRKLPIHLNRPVI